MTKRELNEIKNAYNVMIKDGYIDDQELETLTIMIDKVVNDGYTLKSLATSQNDLRTNERKPAMRVENMPKSAKTTQIRLQCKPRIRNVGRQIAC